MVKVPDTDSFSLQDVIDIVAPSSDDLVQCFADAVADYFNSDYEGSKNSLLNFRDYGPGTYITASDWYLPSLSQLENMYDELHLYGLGNFDYTPPVSCTIIRWWSSTELVQGGSQAYIKNFEYGATAYYYKTMMYRVRAVREFQTYGDQYNLRDTGPSGGLIFYKQLISGSTWLYHEAMRYDQGPWGVDWDTAVSLCDDLVYPPPILVTDIIITAEGGATTITTNEGTLQLYAEVLPSDATNKNVDWSILEDSGEASISDTGLVTAIADGTVTARATAQDGSGVYDDYVITISNQVNSVSLSSNSLDFSTSPNFDSVVVTSSESWTAAIISDPDNLINLYTTGGNNGDILNVSINTMANGYYEAQIGVTAGTATAYLTITLNQT